MIITPKFTKAERLSARQAAIQNAMSVNNVLSASYLESLPNEQLLCFVHPLERNALAVILEAKPKTVGIEQQAFKK